MKATRSNPQVEFTSLFTKQRRTAPREIALLFIETLEVFLEDPDNAHLRNHQLRGKFSGYRSINVTEDWRAIYKEKRKGQLRVITFVMLGTHAQLYTE